MMNARRPTDWPILHGGAITLAGLIAQEPQIALAGALAALIGSGHPGLALASGTEMAPPRIRLKARIHGMFRTSSGSGGDASEASSGAPSDESAGSKSYEEFTAGLDDDDAEEISFLPPYMSGSPSRADRSPSAPTSNDDAGGSRGSVLMNDLEDGEGAGGKMPVSRRFALGTVAIIRHLLEPAEVERILLEQRRYPRLRFGDIAVQLDLLTTEELQELLQAQQDGIFTDEEIQDARHRLAAFHRGEG